MDMETELSVQDLAEQLLAQAKAAGVALTTAESCTGGLISALITDISGSSDVFVQGIVSYANAAKVKLLNVPESLLEEHGAVSEPVARAMAEGAVASLQNVASELGFQAYLSVAVTGIAGPAGGTDIKPVGTVHLASSLQRVRNGKLMPVQTVHHRAQFEGDRNAVRWATVHTAIMMMSEQLVE